MLTGMAVLLTLLGILAVVTVVASVHLHRTSEKPRDKKKSRHYE